MTRIASTLFGTALVTLIGAAALPAQAQGMTRTLDDLRAEYRAQCGKGGSRERLLVAYDRAIRIAPGPASRKQLAAQRAAVANPRDPVCPEPRPLAPRPVPPVPVADSNGGPEDVCDRPPPNPRLAECKRFQRILGRWTSPKYGGVIELYLTPDGTLSGTIISGNKQMRDFGYSAGMQIFRGYRCRTNNLVWPVLCEGGEAVITSQPNNKYGEAFTVQRWQKASLITLNKGNPERLGYPLDTRLSNYDPLVRN